MATNEFDDDQTREFTNLTAGTKVSHYTIVSKIGAGGMGEVYLAEDTNLKRQVALKFMPAHLVSDSDFKARFVREAEATAKLNHPNIVTIHEVSEYNGRPFFSMELVEGQSLHDLAKDKELGIDRIIELAIQICDGLSAAHDKKVVHRDIKPSNIVIDAYGRPKILDFGLAAIQGGEQLTKTGSTLGTVRYMSPEQVEGKEIDHRSDLFSLGIVLYELITGRTPFEKENEAATLRSIGKDNPEPLSRYKSDIPEELQRTVSKLLEKDPSLRYQHSDGIVSDLRRLSASTLNSIGVVTPKKKSNLSFVIIGLVIIVALVVAGIKYWPTSNSGQMTISKTERKMLAVLPFENLGNAEDEGFADGITDAITSRIAKISGLGVIARTSILQYKGTTKRISEIGAELGVDFVLEGTILWDKSNDIIQIRIIPQLIQVSDESHIWTETYERALHQIFAIQGEIAASIAENLDITLLQLESDALAEKPTESTEAYHAYLAGQSLRVDSEDVIMYERAVELDSNFALAYAALSKAHSGYYHDNFDRSADRLRRAKEAVDKALELQPDLPEVHLALGYYHYWGFRNYDEALREFSIAARGLPNDPRILQAEAFIWRRQGRFEDAQTNLERAFQLNPRDSDAAYQVAANHQWLRNFEEALEFLDKAILMEPDLTYNYSSKAFTLLHMGDLASARRVLSNAPNQEQFGVAWGYLEMCARDYDAFLERLALVDGATVNAGGSFTAVNQWRGNIYNFIGDSVRARIAFDSARTFLESHEEEYSEYPGYHIGLAIVYAGLGLKEEAIRMGRLAVGKFPISQDALTGARQEHSLAYVYVMTGEYEAAIDQLDLVLSIPFNLESVATLRMKPIWDPIRDHPRFQALIEKYD